MKTNTYFKFIVAVVASVYFLWCAFNPGQWHFIDNVNLFIHEGGHIIFIPFGQFMTVLGGSLTQVLLPLLFVLYFWRQGQSYSAALTLFWVGENLANVSWYARDAQVMQLPLLFGDGSIHDWHWLLSTTGLLTHTQGIATFIQLLGLMATLTAAAWALYPLFASED